MQKSKEKVKSIIEALLFVWGDPLSLKDLSEILEIKAASLEPILEEMIDDYSESARGLQLTKIKNNYQLGTKPEHHSWIEKLNRPQKAKSLSNAALETLSIIAYKQPVIKSDIESIRGVKSDTAIYTLLNKELIEERGRLDRIGRPIVYGTTDNFLKVFGLEDLSMLPELKESLVEDGELEEKFREEFKILEIDEDDRGE